MARNKVDLPEPEGPDSKVVVPASVQRRHRLSHRTGSSAAVAKESAARPPTARSLLDLVGRPRSLISGGLARVRAHALTEGKCWGFYEQVEIIDPPFVLSSRAEP